MRVAIVHYWLKSMRGGEKVVEALCEMYPEADIFTHVVNRAALSPVLQRHRIFTTFISKLPNAQNNSQVYLPFMPAALEALDLTGYDLVISSESGPAKGVIVRPEALHVCYCHSPMRYLWDQYHVYRATAGRLARLTMPWLFHNLRQWDVTSAARVDDFVANSTIVAKRIRKYWRRESVVIPPPVDVGRFAPQGEPEDYYLHVGELVRYKRVDLAIEACNRLGRRLKIIGAGPEEKALRKIAGPTIEFLGRADDAAVARAFQHARAFLFPAEEDFGIVAVEAMAAGRPVLAYGRGGARDTVIEGKTGLFFAAQTAEGLMEAITRYEADPGAFAPAAIAAHAQRFSTDAFKAAMKAHIEALLTEEARR